MVKKIKSGSYEVKINGRTLRVTHDRYGDLSGLWIVREQDTSLKAKGVDHWFVIAVEASKRDAIRMINDNF